MPFGNQSKANILDPIFGDAGGWGSFSAAPAIHVALSTTTPANDGTNVTEPPGGAAYARQVAGAAVWGPATVATPSEKQNVTPVTFPQATGSWGTITHIVYFDALTAGNYVASGALTAAKAIDTDDTLNFAAGAITNRIND